MSDFFPTEALANFRLEEEKRAKAEAEQRRRKAEEVVQANAVRREALIEALKAETPDAGASELLLLGMAAHEGALGERLASLQLTLANGADVFGNDPKAVLTLSKALHEVTTVRALTTKRAADLLQCAANLRTQRRFTLRGVGSA